MIRHFKSDLLHSIDTLTETIRAERVRRLQDLNLNEWDANILLGIHQALLAQPGKRITSSDIAEATGAGLSYISRAVSRLTKRGILEQAITPDDRRYRYIKVTDKIDLNALAAIDSDIESRVLAKVSGIDQQNIISLMEKINDF